MQIPVEVRQYWHAQWWIFMHFGLPVLLVLLVAEFVYRMWQRYGKRGE